MDLILYFIVAYSISFMFVYSMGPLDIFDRIRQIANNISPYFGALFECMYCFPCWVGIALSILNIFAFPTIFFTPFYTMLHSSIHWIFIVILDMFVTSGGVYIMDSIIKRLLGEIDNGE